MCKIMFVVSRPLEINTSASVRNKAMIEGLIANGHQVDVVTTVPDVKHKAYDPSLSVKGINIKRISMSNSQKIVSFTRRFKVLNGLKKQLYRLLTKHEIYDHFKSMANHTHCIDMKQNQYDYIISSSDPKSSHLFAMKLISENQENFRGKWIQIWGDPFYGDITRINKNGKRIKKEERRLLQAADYIFYVSRLTLEKQKKLYPESADRMEYTPIPYVSSKITENKKLKNVTSITLAYCGDYSPKVRNLVPLYNVVNHETNLKLIICGDSVEPLKSTKSVEVLGRVPYETTCSIEESADILVFVANRTGTQIPGKIYQYAGTNKPILFILDGESELIKENFNQYMRFVFAYNDSESITTAIEKIVDNDIEYTPLDAFSKENIMSAFIDKVASE